MNNQSLRQVMETTYLEVVLTDDVSCVKDVERAKLAFFKKLNYVYQNFSFVIKKNIVAYFPITCKIVLWCWNLVYEAK